MARALSKWVIASVVHVVITVEDEEEQVGGAVVLLKYLLYPVKEQSGELLRLSNNLYPCCSTGCPGG